MTAASLLPYFWRRMTDDVLPDVNRQLTKQGLPSKIAQTTNPKLKSKASAAQRSESPLPSESAILW